MYMPLTLHHAKWEIPRNYFCFLVWTNFWHPTYFWYACLSHLIPRNLRRSKWFSLLSSVDEFCDTLHTSDIHTSDTLHHAQWEGPRDFFCILVWMNFWHLAYFWHTYLSHPTPHKTRMSEQFFLLSSVDEFLTPYMLLTYTPLTPYTAHTPCIHLTYLALTPYYRTGGLSR